MLYNEPTPGVTRPRQPGRGIAGPIDPATERLAAATTEAAMLRERVVELKQKLWRAECFAALPHRDIKETLREAHSLRDYKPDTYDRVIEALEASRDAHIALDKAFGSHRDPNGFDALGLRDVMGAFIEALGEYRLFLEEIESGEFDE